MQILSEYILSNGRWSMHGCRSSLATLSLATFVQFPSNKVHMTDVNQGGAPQRACQLYHWSSIRSWELSSIRTLSYHLIAGAFLCCYTHFFVWLRAFYSLAHAAGMISSFPSPHNRTTLMKPRNSEAVQIMESQ